MIVSKCSCRTQRLKQDTPQHDPGGAPEPDCSAVSWRSNRDVTGASAAPLYGLCVICLCSLTQSERLSCSLLSALALEYSCSLSALSRWLDQIRTSVGCNIMSQFIICHHGNVGLQAQTVTPSLCWCKTMDMSTEQRCPLKKKLPGSPDLLWCWTRWDQTFGFSDFDSLIKSGALWYKEICTVLTLRSYLVLCFDSLNPRWTVCKIWEVASFPAFPQCCLLFTGPCRQKMMARWENSGSLLFCYDNQAESKTVLLHITHISDSSASTCGNWNGDIISVRCTVSIQVLLPGLQSCDEPVDTCSTYWHPCDKSGF